MHSSTSRVGGAGALLCGALLSMLAACNNTDGPIEQQNAAPIVTYSGTFTSGLQRGTITLTSGPSATGTLRLGGTNTDVPLAGTFNSATTAFAMSGGGYTVTAQPVSTASAAVVSADAQVGEAMRAAILASPPALTGTVSGGALTLNASLAAVPLASGTTATRYCGVYTGPDAGMFDLMINGTTAAANVAGMGGGGTMTGTVNGSAVTLSLTVIKPSGRNTITANIVINGTLVSGTGTSTEAPNEVVAITANSNGCADTAPAAPFTGFVGLVYKGSVPGIVSFDPGSPSTGTITYASQAAVALTGTYNSATGAVSLTGGGYTVTATTNATGFTGTVASLDAANGAQIIGLGSNATTQARRYCGSYTGPRQGFLRFVISGSSVVMLQQDNGIATVLSAGAGGTWIYGAIGTSWYYAGSGTSTSMTGTWTNVSNQLGTWTATAC